ncbi:DUF4376 domain-containing protein, partial [Rhodobacterales bacterium]
MAKYAEIKNGKVVTISFDPRTGWPQVPDTVFPGDFENGDGTFTRPTPVVSTTQIDAERDRRLLETFEFEGRIYQCDQEGQRNIAGAKSMAADAIALGAEAGAYDWQRLV